MPKQVPEAELDAILRAVARFPEGAAIEEVDNLLEIKMPRRTLQCRLEGNTYTLLETERLLDIGERAEGRDVREAQMILNHKAAIELLVDQASEVGFGLNGLFL